ncbi:MAG: hypothetical protein OXD29_08830 [Roseovarius sp.]|nr:hypothetical protein [Roseovarius sp.]MCY4208038.1 hypothetical protein [Roseovarius sp.]MCY4290408.1 hypothetical protein [Roseovarius sp.]MCY4315413.1 hypothetical protein [Roseovarius sp.]
MQDKHVTQTKEIKRRTISIKKLSKIDLPNEIATGAHLSSVSQNSGINCLIFFGIEHPSHKKDAPKSGSVPVRCEMTLQECRSLQAD